MPDDKKTEESKPTNLQKQLNIKGPIIISGESLWKY